MFRRVTFSLLVALLFVAVASVVMPERLVMASGIVSEGKPKLVKRIDASIKSLAARVAEKIRARRE